MSIIYSNLNTNGYKSIKYLYKNSTMFNSNINSKKVNTLCTNSFKKSNKPQTNTKYK